MALIRDRLRNLCYAVIPHGLRDRHRRRATASVHRVVRGLQEAAGGSCKTRESVVRRPWTNEASAGNRTLPGRGAIGIGVPRAVVFRSIVNTISEAEKVVVALCDVRGPFV